jgi:hypothetical protein
MREILGAHDGKDLDVILGSAKRWYLPASPHGFTRKNNKQ